MKSFLIALPSGDKIPLRKNSTSIGRGKDNDVVAEIRYISKRHCRIFRKGYRCFIEDLSSSNGTFVNGLRIRGTVELHDNDTVTLSPKGTVYQFCSPPASVLWDSVLRARVRWARLLRSALRRFPLGVIQKQHLPATLSIGAGVILLVLFGFLLRGGYGKVDVNGDLAKIRTIYGLANIPEDPEFAQAVGRYVGTLRNSRSLDLVLRRKKKYIGIIEPILAEMKIPRDYYLIPWVESKYDPNALNRRSGARGMWQLMPRTARHYGLRVDGSVDERIDPEKATRAAAAYLNDLVSMFGADSFCLILAAYNAGETRVLYGLKQIQDPVRDRHFWYLYRNNLIPEETKQYVLKILALMVVKDELEG